MAKLERYELQVKNQGLSIGPGSMLSPSHVSPGRDIAEGMSSVQGALGTLYTAQEEERKKAEAFVVADRDVAFAKEAGDVLYNSETGALNKQGENALDTAKVHQKIEEIRQKYINSLSTPDAQKAFDLRSRVRAEALRDAVERHAGAERNKLYVNTAKNSQSETERQAALNFRSLGDVEALIELNDSTQRTALRVAGVPADQIETQIKQSEAAVYSAVLGEYVARAADDPSEWENGLVFLNSVEDSMGDHGQKWRATFEKGIAPVRIARDGDGLTTAIVENSTDPSTQRFDYNHALGILDTVDPAQKVRLGKYVEEKLRDAANAQARDDAQRVARLDQVISAGGSFETHPDFVALDDVGQATVRRLKRTYDRERRADRTQARIEQNNFNTIALNDLIAMGADEGSKLTPEDLKAKFPDADAKGQSALRAKVATMKVISAKGHATGHDAMADLAGGIANTLFTGHTEGTKKHRADFVAEAMAWWSSKAIGTGQDVIPPGKNEVSDYLAKQVVKYDIPLATDRTWAEMTASERAKYGKPERMLPLSEQPYPALVARLFEANPPLPAAPTAATPKPPDDPMIGKIKIQNGIKYRVDRKGADGNYILKKVVE